MSDNKTIWDSFSQPPASALTPIQGGRLKGMTDINPQWRLEAMTEVFGPCGIGWRYTVDKLWTVDGSEDEVFAFATVSLFVLHEGNWSEAIPGVGGNKLVAREKGGLFNNDESYKMAVTDALSVAMKTLGVASDVYAGLWDGSKFQIRPEYIVTASLLNSVKQKFSKVYGSALNGQDQPAKKAFFSSWCKDQFGELVDYHDPNSWSREWVDQAIEALNSEVPFDE